MKLGYTELNLNIWNGTWIKEVTLSCSLIHKGLSEQEAPHILIWQIFAPVALPNTISKGYMSPSGNKSGIIHLLS